MPAHPAAPTDLPGLVAAFAHTTQAVADLGGSLTDEQFALETQCPGWSVQDQISHVTALESALEGLEPFREAAERAPHMTQPTSAYTESGVAARRDRSGQDVVRELAYVRERRLDHLASPGLEADSIIAGPFGPDTATTVVRMRTVDVWTHEQDIREAINAMGNLDSPAASVFVDAAIASLPRTVARRAEVPVGDTVIVELTGPVTARVGVRVDEGEDGRPHGTIIFGGAGDANQALGSTTTTLRAIDPNATITTIKMSSRFFARRAAGRMSTDEITYTVSSGDEQTARRVLDALNFMS